MNARVILGRFVPAFVMMPSWKLLLDVDRRYTDVVRQEIFQAKAQHVIDPMGNLYQEYYSKVVKHTTMLTDWSERSLNLWTGTLSNVSWFHLQKQAEGQNIPAARFMNWIDERIRLPFEIPLIQLFETPQPVVGEVIPPPDPVQILAQIDQIFMAVSNRIIWKGIFRDGWD